MIKILIADDDENKIKDLQEFILSFCKISCYFIDISKNIHCAKEKLRNEHYDLLLLDIQMPMYDRGKEKRDAGIILLRKIIYSNELGDKYFIPSNIIGISAFDDIYENARNEFNNYGAFTVIKYKQSLNDWKENLGIRLNQILNSKLYECSFSKNNDNIVITVHGIRTLGNWQKRLTNIIKRYNNDVKVYNFDYGYFSLFAYIFPPFRYMIVKRFEKDLVRVFDCNLESNYHFICHSFGTYIVAKTLLKFSKDNFKVSTLILSGSVLGCYFDWNKLISNNKIVRVINDCGINDNVLIINKIFVLMSGMAGRLGFRGFSSDRLVNRYFIGGHSLYFYKNNKEDDNFMEKYWVPLIVTNDAPVQVNELPVLSGFGGIKIFLLQKIWVLNLFIYLYFFYMLLNLI